MAVVLHMTAEEGSRLWHGFAGQGGSVFSRGERVETRTPLCRGVEGQILSVSDMGILRQQSRQNTIGREHGSHRTTRRCHT
jgi:hypothetical protein